MLSVFCNNPLREAPLSDRTNGCRFWKFKTPRPILGDTHTHPLSIQSVIAGEPEHAERLIRNCFPAPFPLHCQNYIIILLKVLWLVNDHSVGNTSSTQSIYIYLSQAPIIISLWWPFCESRDSYTVARRLELCNSGTEDERLDMRS